MIESSEAMNLTHTPNLSRVGDRCKLSRGFEHAGNFADATSIMGSYWQGVGVKPDVAGLPQPLAADVLLRIGVLTGWLGVGADEAQAAESIINEALSLYASLDLTSKVAEAEVELAECHWRCHRPEDARQLLMSALDKIDTDGDLKARAVHRLANAELTSGRASESIALLDDSRKLFESAEDESLMGKYYGSLVAALLLLAESQGAASQDESLERSFVECAAARMFFERAGNIEGVAQMQNNLGCAYLLKGKYADALEQLEAAHEAFSNLGVRSMLAHVDETRARVLLAQGDLCEAEMYAASSIAAMEAGGEKWALAAALTTQGRAFARLGRTGAAKSCFNRAIGCANIAGNVEAAKQARQAMLEELGERITDANFETAGILPNNVIAFPLSRMDKHPHIVTMPDNSLLSLGIREGQRLEFRRELEFTDGQIVLVDTADGELIARGYHEPDEGLRLEWTMLLSPPRYYDADEYSILGVAD